MHSFFVAPVIVQSLAAAAALPGQRSLPCWGYGIRYSYGMFKQGIKHLATNSQYVVFMFLCISNFCPDSQLYSQQSTKRLLCSSPLRDGRQIEEPDFWIGRGPRTLSEVLRLLLVILVATCKFSGPRCILAILEFLYMYVYVGVSLCEPIRLL